MSARPSLTDRSLRAKVRGFFRSEDRGQRQVARLIDRLADVGPIAIFGGMLRDLALDRIAAFKSDIDLVVARGDGERLHDALQPYAALRNRFGGYRFTYAGWKIDLWALEDTWAIKAGHVAGHDLEDLVSTTFFSWDAVVFEYGSGAIHSHASFYESIEKRTVDINLEPNPFEIGAAGRALRLIQARAGRLQPRRSEWLYSRLEDIEAADICDWEAKHYGSALLTPTSINAIRGALASHVTMSRSEPFDIVPRQLAFPDSAWRFDFG
jgi:hypothetical protein